MVNVALNEDQRAEVRKEQQMLQRKITSVTMQSFSWPLYPFWQLWSEEGNTKLMVIKTKNRISPHHFRSLSKSHSKRHWCETSLSSCRRPNWKWRKAPVYGRRTYNINFSLFPKPFIFPTLIWREKNAVNNMFHWIHAFSFSFLLSTNGTWVILFSGDFPI